MRDKQKRAAIRRGLADAIEDWLGQAIPEAERLAQYILDELQYFPLVEAARTLTTEIDNLLFDLEGVPTILNDTDHWGWNPLKTTSLCNHLESVDEELGSIKAALAKVQP